MRKFPHFFSRIYSCLLANKVTESERNEKTTNQTNKQTKANLFQKHRHMEQKPLVDQVPFR